MLMILIECVDDNDNDDDDDGVSISDFYQLLPQYYYFLKVLQT